MKKLFFSFISTFMFFSITFSQTTINYSEYGYYHNEALALFTEKYGNHQKDVNFIIDESIKLMQVKYPELFNDINSSIIKNAFNVTNADNFDYKKVWNSYKTNSLNYNKIPQRIASLIDFIVNNDLTFEEAIVRLDDFKTSNNLKVDELNSLTAIKSVLVSSHQYWNSANRKGPRIGSATLFADFAGAGMFSWTGPVAAIAGFACSYITHQNDY